MVSVGTRLVKLFFFYYFVEFDYFRFLYGQGRGRISRIGYQEVWEVFMLMVRGLFQFVWRLCGGLFWRVGVKVLCLFLFWDAGDIQDRVVIFFKLVEWLVIGFRVVMRAFGFYFASVWLRRQEVLYRGRWFGLGGAGYQIFFLGG